MRSECVKKRFETEFTFVASFRLIKKQFSVNQTDFYWFICFRHVQFVARNACQMQAVTAIEPSKNFRTFHRLIRSRCFKTFTQSVSQALEQSWMTILSLQNNNLKKEIWVKDRHEKASGCETSLLLSDYAQRTDLGIKIQPAVKSCYESIWICFVQLNFLSVKHFASSSSAVKNFISSLDGFSHFSSN